MGDKKIEIILNGLNCAHCAEVINQKVKELDDIDCEPEIYYSAAEMLENDYLDTGFTYTAPEMRVTFIVMMESSCADEF